MARTVQECNDYIVSNLVTQFASVGITISPTLWSKTNFIRLLAWSFAIAQSLAEQLQDIAITKMQSIADVSTAGNAPWLQDNVFKFQYSATTPQYLIFTSGVSSYEVVNESLRIVTACSVSSTITNVVNIKVAKGATTLTSLSGPELTALQGYVNLKGTAGIVYNVSSSDPDRLYLEGTIYYQGLYSAVISANVIAAIDSYLLNLSKTRFGGDILMSDIEGVVRNIEGVNDVVFERVSLRYSTQSVLGGIDLVSGGDWVIRKYTFGAGYCKQEDTATYTFADKLTFVAE